jgi:aspartate aminotransferase
MTLGIPEIKIPYYYIPNERISRTKISLIRSIIETPHENKLSRISLGLGELTFPMPRLAQEANKRAIKEGKTGYTPNAGLPELRDAVAKRFSRQHNLMINRENVIITAGSTGGLFIAFETLLNPNDEVLIPQLYYPLYKSLPQKWGAMVIPYALTANFEPDVTDILYKISPKTKIIVLNSPSNPTAQLIPESTLRQLSKAAEKHPSLFFLSDEIYSSFVYEENFHQSIRTFSDRTLIVNGLSKEASQTGKRLGWIIGPDYFIHDALKSQQITYVCAPTDSQYAALPIINGLCDRQLAHYHKELNNRRKLMNAYLSVIPNLRFQESQGAFYYFVDVSAFGDGLQVAKKLIAVANVVTVPGLAFGETGENYIRLSYACGQDAITEGMKRMKGVFSQWN